MLEPLFTIDGESFDVEVVSLRREFALNQAHPAAMTLDGSFHRELTGSYCHYRLTVRTRRDPGELERFWEAVSAPKETLTCTFPYGDGWLTQQMFVESGTQELTDAVGANRWDAITLRFVGAKPRVSL